MERVGERRLCKVSGRRGSRPTVLLKNLLDELADLLMEAHLARAMT